MADGSYAKAHQDAAGGKGGPRFKLLDALAVALPPKSTLSWTGCHHRRALRLDRRLLLAPERPAQLAGERALGRRHRLLPRRQHLCVACPQSRTGSWAEVRMLQVD